jgi:hypothetical protein
VRTRTQPAAPPGAYRYPAPVHPRLSPRIRGFATASSALLVLCLIGLGACGNTLQDQPVAPSFLESLIMQEEFPVYWLGGTFQRLPIINVGRDPSGAYEIQYGNCTQGGEDVCVTPLEIVTSPDNSFRPGGSTPLRLISVRGVPGTLAQDGKTIELSTGGVVVDIYADSPALARAAAHDTVAINALQLPGSTLPRALPNTGYGEKPLPSQEPPLTPVAQSLSVG